MPALIPLPCWDRRLPLCQQAETRVNRLRHVTSWWEQQWVSVVCSYIFANMNEPAMFLAIWITSGFAAGSLVAYFINSDCSLTSGDPLQKWNMIVFFLRSYLVYSYNVTKCFGYSLFSLQVDDNQASIETGGLYLCTYCLSGDVSLPPFFFYLLYRCIRWLD